ncbi:DUF167 family protein [Methylobacterium planeticum]|uniref:UPF0235 protein F6X51_20755 n=1 Tax=Methylobacterium planeticum TaxID=2615211 RepID=A0A6N6MMA7_9HYPH|nr:DUF167 family protein [Methylobacterium planeticum]KAB1070949.1 hypothetical protein F6X51_20755 [Methylobacterium planeticum]
MPSDPTPYSIDPEGLRLAVRLTPRGGRDAVEGVIAGADGRPVLALRVAAAPVDGEANAALIAFLAKALKLRKRDVAILSGETGRLKILRLSGDGAVLAGRLAAWIGAAMPGPA